MSGLDWHRAATRLARSGGRGVLVTAARVRGSAPCAPGTRMVVSGDDSYGTIGGGNLELLAIDSAREMIDSPGGDSLMVEENALGPDLDQCCGGSVLLVFQRIDAGAVEWLDRWAELAEGDRPSFLATTLDPASPEKTFYQSYESGDEPIDQADSVTVTESGPSSAAVMIERLENPRQRLWLFGAGHVGRAIARALEPLPFHITWIDSRPEILPPESSARLTPRLSAAPERDVAAIPAGAGVLVLTHSHKLDLDICAAALLRDELAFVGLIGSATKRARFVRLLGARGIGDGALARLVCPIGLPGITGKAPAVIAASVAAQLLSYQSAPAAKEKPKFQELREQLRGQYT